MGAFPNPTQTSSERLSPIRRFAYPRRDQRDSSRGFRLSSLFHEAGVCRVFAKLYYPFWA